MKNTKQELLDAYNQMRQQLQERDRTQLKPEQKVQEKKEAQVLAARIQSLEKTVKEQAKKQSSED